MELSKYAEIARTRGAPLRVGARTVTPVSWSLRLSLPAGGVVWTRPVAVVVEEGGTTEEIPIVDVTLIARLALLGAAGAFTVAGWLAGRSKTPAG